MDPDRIIVNCRTNSKKKGRCKIDPKIFLSENFRYSVIDKSGDNTGGGKKVSRHITLFG
jgi:hypothetical protein